MQKREVAVIGLGKVGRACGELILSSQDLSLSGIVRRPESIAEPLPKPFQGVPVVSQVAQLPMVETVLLCVPPEIVDGLAHDILQHGIPIVDSAMLHGETFLVHKKAIHRVAVHHQVPAIVGVGWDPGIISLVRSLFSLLIPKGHTQTIHRLGKNLHHTVTAESVPGVKEALCTERRTVVGKQQRYVYIEIEEGADQDRVVEAIRSDPLFLEEETFVFPVDSVAALEEMGHGIMLERRGASGRTGHQHLLLEARFDVTALTAQMMIAAARVLHLLEPGAYSLLELPIGQFLGEQLESAEKEFM